MTKTEDVEKADRLSRRRMRMVPGLAAIFLVQQASYFSGQIEDAARTVDHVKIAAWLALSIALLLFVTTGGFWFHSRPVRQLLNDEATRANRVEGLRVGFIAAMAAGIVLYFVALFEPVSGHDAIHLLMTAGIAAALLRFGQLERRDHRDG